jgi:hypothetical protein
MPAPASPRRLVVLGLLGLAVAVGGLLLWRTRAAPPPAPVAAPPGSEGVAAAARARPAPSAPATAPSSAPAVEARALGERAAAARIAMSSEKVFKNGLRASLHALRSRFGLSDVLQLQLDLTSGRGTPVGGHGGTEVVWRRRDATDPPQKAQLVEDPNAPGHYGAYIERRGVTDEHDVDVQVMVHETGLPGAPGEVGVLATSVHVGGEPLARLRPPPDVAWTDAGITVTVMVNGTRPGRGAVYGRLEDGAGNPLAEAADAHALETGANAFVLRFGPVARRSDPQAKDLRLAGVTLFAGDDLAAVDHFWYPKPLIP